MTWEPQYRAYSEPAFGRACSECLHHPSGKRDFCNTRIMCSDDYGCSESSCYSTQRRILSRRQTGKASSHVDWLTGCCKAVGVPHCRQRTRLSPARRSARCTATGCASGNADEAAAAPRSDRCAHWLSNGTSSVRSFRHGFVTSPCRP